MGTGKFRYLKWHITKKRNPGLAIQVSEFQLLDINNNIYTFPSGTAVTSTPAGYATLNETADKLIDGLTSTKLCVNTGDWSSSSSQTGNLVIIFDVGEGNTINLSNYYRYSYFTGNDDSDRDPITWTLYASNDGDVWELLDNRAEQTQIPTERQTQAGIWEMSTRFINRKFQNGIVGRTNVIEKVSIDDNLGQIVNYAMLYDYGDECGEITGGWIGHEADSWYTAGDYVKNTDNLYMYENVADYGMPAFTTNTTFDLTQCAKFGFIATWSAFSSSPSYQSNSPILYITNKTLWNIRDSTTKSAILFDDNKVYGERISQNTPKLVICDINSSRNSGDRLTYYTDIINSCHLSFTVSCGSYSYDTATANIYMFALFKNDDIATLASKAGITASSITDILTNSSTLLANESAVNFMCKKCTGDFMASAMASDTFLTALESSPYKNKVYANPHWAKFLAMVS